MDKTTINGAPVSLLQGAFSKDDLVALMKVTRLVEVAPILDDQQYTVFLNALMHYSIKVIGWVESRETSANVAQDDDTATLHKLAEHLESGSSSIFSYEAGEKYARLLRGLLARTAPANVAQGAKLSVWYGSMPESNGKTNWTAILHKGDIAEDITIDRSEYPDRVRYEADRMRWMIGEIDKEPWILDYDADKHSGYTAPPAQTAITDDARECLMDVVSHHHDFRTACIEIKAANETTRSDELYWQKQIDVLDRMKGQAERALTAAQSASGDTQ
jgi:hypothetical protein